MLEKKEQNKWNPLVCSDSTPSTPERGRTTSVLLVGLLTEVSVSATRIIATQGW